MLNLFQGRSLTWLIEQRDALQGAIASEAGSITRTAIAPSMADEFTELDCAELESRLLKILYALFILEPTKYPNPYAQKRMTVTTVYPGSYGGGCNC